MLCRERGGSFVHNAATCLLKRGYDVTWHCNVRYFNVLSSIPNETDQGVIRRYFSRSRPYITQAMRAGCRFIPRAATLWDFRDALRAGGVVVAGVDAYVIWRQRSRRRSWHAVIVGDVDFRRQVVTVIDPEIGRYQRSFSDFLSSRYNEANSITIFKPDETTVSSSLRVG